MTDERKPRPTRRTAGAARDGAARGAAAFLPDRRTLVAAREAAARCRGCDLYRAATQTVFGAGAADAPLMLVGETPGDHEDLEGEPFVGPAGRLLDRALAEAGIDRAAAYVTNVVKHFKFEPRGKRRLHRRPLPGEIAACSAWLRLELELVQPRVLVCLGATAAHALIHRQFSVTRDRGRIVRSQVAPVVLATLHPSALLRMPSAAARAQAFAELVADLRLARRELEAGTEP